MNKHSSDTAVKDGRTPRDTRIMFSAGAQATGKNQLIPQSIRRLQYHQFVITAHNSNPPTTELNKALLKHALIDLITHAADQTTLELNQLRDSHRLPDEYQTGELVGAGTLYCDRCGMPHVMALADLVGKCENCGNTRFRTQH